MFYIPCVHACDLFENSYSSVSRHNLFSSETSDEYSFCSECWAVSTIVDHCC